MTALDNQEKLIVKELIKDPRISDNQIAIKTNVPLKTVNRKRKILEEKNILNYYCYLDNTHTGTGTFDSRVMFVIVMRDGITRQMMTENHAKSHKAMKFFPKHILHSYLGDFEGNIAIMTILESHKAKDILEIYNAEIIPEMEAFYGRGCVKRTITIPIMTDLRIMRNYLPGKNIANGKIKKDWPDENIFIGD